MTKVSRPAPALMIRMRCGLGEHRCGQPIKKGYLMGFKDLRDKNGDFSWDVNLL
jgi:hypothetical protein